MSAQSQAAWMLLPGGMSIGWIPVAYLVVRRKLASGARAIPSGYRQHREAYEQTGDLGELLAMLECVRIGDEAQR